MQNNNKKRNIIFAGIGLAVIAILLSTCGIKSCNNKVEEPTEVVVAPIAVEEIFEVMDTVKEEPVVVEEPLPVKEEVIEETTVVEEVPEEIIEEVVEDFFDISDLIDENDFITEEKMTEEVGDLILQEGDIQALYIVGMNTDGTYKTKLRATFKQGSKFVKLRAVGDYEIIYKVELDSCTK